MTDIQTKQQIQTVLTSFRSVSLLGAARNLFDTLGYRSNRRIDLPTNTAAAFVAAFNIQGDINAGHAQLDQWRSVDMLFQLTGTELKLGAQLHLALLGAEFARSTYQSFLFFAIHLESSTYTRTELAAITREVNKLFEMPVSVLFRHGDALTLAIVTHRPNKNDGERDVLEKVTLIKDIALSDTHRAHIEILHDLALPELAASHSCANFDGLQLAWQATLDISTLNKRFYRELADWYFWALQQVKFPADAEPNAATRNATSVIRLITRLIFVWFLREKGLVPDALFRRADMNKLLTTLADGESSYYKAILQNLFFATLNQEMNTAQKPDNRKFRNDGQNYNVTNLLRYRALFTQPDTALALFATVPFLNGGLFECLDKPADGSTKPLRIDGFSDRPDNVLNVPNELFFGAERAVDLSAVYDSTAKSKTKVRGLLRILDRYKFTIAENTPIEQEVALAPELLGQVFENLLASYNPETQTTARKQTGSFYTPREIVSYMVDESLLAYLERQLGGSARLVLLPASGEDLTARLRQLLAYTDEPQCFNKDETRLLIVAIDSLHIIDPACGSGAFPMGILQKLVYVLGKLDPENEHWRDQQRRRAVHETEATFDIGDKSERERRLLDISDAFEHNSSDYGRKLFLIENCIYGVDIQPIAMQIAKLRCFITLIVDQRVDDARENRGIRALPNLETKFVAANALVGLGGQSALRGPEVQCKEGELEDVRRRYFGARTPATKGKYRAEDKRLRAEIAALLRLEGVAPDTASLLAGWDPYDQNASAPFFDPEWMFGVDDGFDVVIANPPYVRQEQLGDLKQLLKGYDTFTGMADLYVYFYERGLRLLKAGGVLTYISSNKFFRAGYGEKLRRYLAANATVRQLIDFGDAPVFTAIAYPCIIVATKDALPHKSDHSLQALTWEPGPPVEEFASVFERGSFLLLQKELTPDGWRLESPATLRLLEKLRAAGTPLGEYVKGRFYRGILTGLNEAFVVDRATRDRLIAEHPSSVDVLKPFLRGRDVKRWRVDFGDQYLIKIESSENKQHPWSGKPDQEAERIFARTYPAIHAWLNQFRAGLIKRNDQGKYFWELRSCAYWQEFEQPKIILGRFMNKATFAYDKKAFVHNDALYMVGGANEYVVAALNSTVSWWFLRQICTDLQNGYLQAFRENLFQIPIPNATVGQQTPIVAHVTRILAAKAKSATANVAILEREIDQIVYRLYGLTKDEIKLVEEATTKGDPSSHPQAAPVVSTRIAR